MVSAKKEGQSGASTAEVRIVPSAAKRALAEAAERRAARDAQPPPPKELNGRKGLDPARYGDWESKGIASDF